MSLTDAYEYLASLEPRLRDLPALRANEPPRKPGFSVGRGSAEPKLVGAWADSPHQILNTDLAWTVVEAYLKVTRNGRAPDADPTPFFERPTGTHAFSFGRPDTRPRARN
jgi:hypothetical protein